MTIAAGFRFADKHGDGVLLAADTLFTVPGVMRLQGVKIFTHHLGSSALAAFAVAGDRAYASMTLDEIESELKALEYDERSLQNMRGAVQRVLVRIYREHLFSRPDFPHYSPNFQFIFVLRSQVGDDIGLFSTQDTAVVEVPLCEFVGVGASLAHYLAKGHLGSTVFYADAIRVAALVLDACKEHVDGCGGSSEFLCINEKGQTSQRMNFLYPYGQQVKEIIEMMRPQDPTVSSGQSNVQGPPS